MPPKMKDITGQRFGRRVAQWPAGRGYPRVTYWLVLCDCGNIDTVAVNALLRGTADSCGCIPSDMWTKHGHRKGAVSTREYNTWLNMIQRCTNPYSQDYINYGARGITVCPEWRVFSTFLSDMGDLSPKTRP